METGTMKDLNVKPGDVVAYDNGKHYRVGYSKNLISLETGMDGGTYPFWDTCSMFSIVSRAIDLTAIKTPFGLLDAATQDALRAHGGPYEAWMTNGTWAVCAPAWAITVVYRVKTAPKRETVTRDMWADAETGLTYRDERPGTEPIRITVEKVDGKADWSTHRVEAR